MNYEELREPVSESDSLMDLEGQQGVSRKRHKSAFKSVQPSRKPILMAKEKMANRSVGFVALPTTTTTSKYESGCESIDFEPSGQPVIIVSAVTKSYDGLNLVLDNINMLVQAGEIYGLLGASGCGKTTLLSCIVGRRHFDSGLINVFGGVPGNRATGVPGNRIGYMPQDLALYDELSVLELLHFFGSVYGVDQEEMERQINFLLNFLALPDAGKQLVKSMSGGQKRRVSLAVALVHDPELLILDEPTVGVDPLLRKNIWNHLVKLARERGKTIVITTHYIEEARSADVVGLMRFGRLLAEDAPQRLMDNFALSKLEDVFLRLCVTSSNNNDDDDDDYRNYNGPNKKNKWTQRGSKKGLSCIQRHEFIKEREDWTDGPSQWEQVSYNGFLSSRRTAAMVTKNFRKMRRNYRQMAFIFFMPAFQIFFFCTAVGHIPKQLPISVVNYEVAFPRECPNFNEDCNFVDISCRFEHSLSQQSSLHPVLYSSEYSARTAVLEERSWGTVVIPRFFSDSLLERLLVGADVTQESIDNSTIEVHLDMSNQQIAYAILGALESAYGNFARDLLRSCDFSDDVIKPTLEFGVPIFGSLNTEFTDFLAPGMIIIIVVFLSMAITSDNTMAIKREGLMERDWVAGITNLEEILSQLLSHFFVLLGQISMTLFVTFYVFQIPCEGNFGYIIALTMLQGVMGMAYGFLLAISLSEPYEVTNAAIGTYYPLLLLSGITWPIEAMPDSIRQVVRFFPCTAACAALRDLVSRGWGIEMASVRFGFLMSCVWIAILVVLCMIMVKKRLQ